MVNEEDECDSSSLFTFASQSDMTSFLHAQATKITGLNSNVCDDNDENSIDDNLLVRFTQVSSKHCSTLIQPYLSHSCFASISSSSSQKRNPVDDLTELKWLNTYKLKEFKENKTTNREIKEEVSQLLNSTEDHISKLSNELKFYNNNHLNTDSISNGVLIFLALYSKRDDQQTPWSSTIKQIYEYIQVNIKQIITKRGWKNLLKQTLNTIPCFIKTKHDLLKSRSIWTIDPYYRPLLTKAYLTSLSLQSNKIISSNENDKKQISVNNFAPKATVKTKALPRLYERLCEEKDESEATITVKDQHTRISGCKRPRSTSPSDYWQATKDSKQKRLSSSSPWMKKLNKYNQHANIEVKTSTLNKASTIITPCPSIDHTYLNLTEKQIEYNESSTDEDDECDSSSLMHPNHKSIITTRAAARSIQNPIRNDFVVRRKTSSRKHGLSLVWPSRRANTRISRKIIEQDLELLRQANIDQQLFDLSILPVNRSLLLFHESIQQAKTDTITSIDGVLDLSLAR